MCLAKGVIISQRRVTFTGQRFELEARRLNPRAQMLRLQTAVGCAKISAIVHHEVLVIDDMESL